MHEMRVMHRDIRPQNMLLLSENPPRAAICDYGKAIEAEVSRDTRIGPIHTLAPEVWTAAESGYTRSIDVWAFNYTRIFLAIAPAPHIHAFRLIVIEKFSTSFEHTLNGYLKMKA